jgi:hypothetical protein
MTVTPAHNRPPARRGRPPGEPYQPVTVRVREPLNSLLDGWRAEQIDRPGRPEALRRLAALALAALAEKGSEVNLP